MSQRYNSFMDELEQLMDKYDLAIFPSNYDNIEIWSTKSKFQTKEQVIRESLNTFVGILE